MGETLLKAGSFILIIISGYLLKKKGLFNYNDNRTIMKLIMNVTLPGAGITVLISLCIITTLIIYWGLGK